MYNEAKDDICKSKVGYIMKKIKTMAVIVMCIMLAGCVKVDKDISTSGISNDNTIKSETQTKPTQAQSQTETKSEKPTESQTQEQTTAAQEQSTQAPTQTPTQKPTEAVVMPYMIKVNRAMNCITVYGLDDGKKYTVPVRAMACSVGDYKPENPNSEPTPVGTFKITDKYEWGLMVDGSYGRYACRVFEDILFHSVPYLGGRVKWGLETDQYNKLGSPASLGCIRLTIEDAKWIFDNCAPGTVVEVYDDMTTPGPLGKPEVIKIPMDSPYKGWDPTDDDPSNPWHKFNATIKGAKDIEVKTGEKADVLKGVKAYDKCGNDITDKIKVTGEYNTDKPGEYKITLSVTDAVGSTDSKEIKVIVK